jgi:hypothetical protein
VNANVSMGNSIEFRLILAVNPSLLADVFNVPWNLNRSNDGQTEDREFRIYVRGRTNSRGDRLDSEITNANGSKSKVKVKLSL